MNRLLQWKQLPQKNLTVSFLFVLMGLLSGFNGLGQIVTGIQSTTPFITAGTGVTVALATGGGIVQAPAYSSSAITFGSKSGGGWNNDGSSATYATAATNNEYVQYAISPAVGYSSLNITGFTIKGDEVTSSTSNYYTVSYATSTASFPSSATFLDSAGNAGNNSWSGVSFMASGAYASGQNITVASGNILYVRIYMWRKNAATSSSQLAITSFSISGTAISNVTYNGNGNTSGTPPTDATNYGAGATVTVASNSGSLAKTSYNFNGWNTAANGSGTNYTAGSGTFSIAGNTTLYANWTGNVTYNGNGSTGGTVPTDATNYESGATVTAATNSGGLVNTGYSFAGWNTAANGSGTAVAAGSSSYSFIGNVTLYAQWTSSLVITYVANYPSGSTGQSGSVPTDGTSYTSGSTATVKANTGTLGVTGYTFTGWNTAANGSGTSYAATGSATFSITAVTDLYAQWVINTYTVTYNNNTGSGSQTDGSSPYNYNSTVTTLGAGTMTNGGYTFAGWSTTQQAVPYSGSVQYAVGATFSITSNTTLYAVWVSPPTITIGTGATLSGFTYVTGAGPSTAQGFTVSGSNLTGNITVTPSTDYQICLTSGGTYVSTALTLTQSSGSVGSTTIYVKLKSALAAGNYNSENIVLTSAGATTQDVVCSGGVTNATPTTSATNPTVAVANTGLTLTVTGTGFVTGASSVTWNGATTGVTTTFVSASLLYATISGSVVTGSSATVGVTTTYAGASSNTQTVTINSYTDAVTWTFASSGAATNTGHVSGTTIVGSPTYTNIGGGTTSTGFVYATVGTNPNSSFIAGLNLCPSQSASTTTWVSDGTSAALNTTFSGITGNSSASTSNDGTRYVQFDVTPGSGYNFTVNNITVPVSSTAPNTNYYAVAYSTDGFNTTSDYTQLGTTTSVTGGSATVPTYVPLTQTGLSIPVYNSL